MPNDDTEFQKNLPEIKIDENGVAKVLVDMPIGMELLDSVIESSATTAHNLGAKRIEIQALFTASIVFKE